jgi:hypothetical protein
MIGVDPANPAHEPEIMSRKEYLVPLGVNGNTTVVRFDSRNLVGNYGQTLMWFVRWEILRLRRLARGKPAPNPTEHEQIHRQVQEVGVLIRAREVAQAEWHKQQDNGETTARWRTHIEKLQRDIDVLSTPIVCFAERYNQQIHRQNLLRRGVIGLAQRLGVSALDMSRFVYSCELAVMELAQWDTGGDELMSQKAHKLFQYLGRFYFEILRPLEDLHSVAEDVGLWGYPASEDASGEARETITGAALERLAAVIGDDNTARIIATANHEELSVDDKMRAIAHIDCRFRGWNSEQWAQLLGKSSAAVRKTETWKRFRKDRGEE